MNNSGVRISTVLLPVTAAPQKLGANLRGKDAYRANFLHVCLLV